MSEPAVEEQVVPPAETVVEEAPAEQAPETDQPATEEQTPPADEAPPKGMLAELISYRQKSKELEREVARLSQAVQERVEAPAAATAAQQREQQALLETATRLRLITTNEAGERVYDLDAARRVDQHVDARARAVATEVLRPWQEMTVAERASDNVSKAVSFAEAQGFSKEVVDIVRRTFTEVPAQMAADPKVATTLYKQAMGEAVTAGVYAPPTKAKAASPPAILAPNQGRRAAGASIQLSPAAAKVYREAGIDPAKTTPHTVDEKGATILRD